MLATEQKCSENMMPEVINRLTKSEGGLRAVAVGDCGSFWFFFFKSIGSTCNVTFSRKQQAKGQSAVQTKSETNFIYQSAFVDINCL